MNYDYDSIKTLAHLTENKYLNRSTKNEMRDNLIDQLKNGTHNFKGIIGYDETVIPDIQSAILSRHSIILLGLRGQAKTKIARLMVTLLDEYVPIISGSELNDNPYNPISKYGKDKIMKAAHGVRRNLNIQVLIAINLGTTKPNGEHWDFSCPSDRKLAKYMVERDRPTWIV